jgi:hypothetical protein
MSIKLMISGRRRPGQTLREHRRHMKDVHGRLVLDYIAAEPDNAPRRYVQNHVFDSVFGAGDPVGSGLSLGFDFITEIWFPDLVAAKASRETQHYLDRLRPDEGRMVDDKRVIGLPFRETEVSGRAYPGAMVKVFALMPKMRAMDSDAFRAGWISAVERAPLPETVQHIRNLALAPGSVDGIDMFRLADEDAAFDFAEAYIALVLQPMQAAGLMEADAAAILIAREFVLHPGRQAQGSF